MAFSTSSAHTCASRSLRLAFLRQFSASRRGVGTGLGVPLLLIDGDDQPHERRFSLFTSDALQDSAQAGRLVLCPNAAHFCWLFAPLTLFTQAVCCLPAGIIAVFPAAVTQDHLDRPLAVLKRAISWFIHLSLPSPCATRVFRHTCSCRRQM